MVESVVKITVALALIAGLSWLSTVFIVDTTWFTGAFEVIFPAIYAIQQLPILDTLTDILFWVIVFEMTFYALKLLLRFLQWLNFTGNPWLD